LKVLAEVTIKITQLLILPFEINFTAEKFAQEFDFGEGSLLHSLCFTKITAGLKDSGDVDFDRAFKMFFDTGFGVPVNLIFVVSVAKR
jgi:hypothetical protein